MRWALDPRDPGRLQDQIASCVRRGAASGELAVGEQLPPAAELAEALSVDRNTVLAAYRQLRDEGVLEFRRGRGARLVAGAPDRAELYEAVREVLRVARAHGLGPRDVIQMIEEST